VLICHPYRKRTQYNDVAAANSAKLKEMQQLLWTELARYQVLPLDASVATRLVAPRPQRDGWQNSVHVFR
jgi:arylsulfatase